MNSPGALPVVKDGATAGGIAGDIAGDIAGGGITGGGVDGGGDDGGGDAGANMALNVPVACCGGEVTGGWVARNCLVKSPGSLFAAGIAGGADSTGVGVDGTAGGAGWVARNMRVNSPGSFFGVPDAALLWSTAGVGASPNNRENSSGSSGGWTAATWGSGRKMGWAFGLTGPGWLTGDFSGSTGDSGRLTVDGMTGSALPGSAMASLDLATLGATAGGTALGASGTRITRV